MKGSGSQPIKAVATSSTANAKRQLQHKYDTICCNSFQALRNVKGVYFDAERIPKMVPSIHQ